MVCIAGALNFCSLSATPIFNSDLRGMSGKNKTAWFPAIVFVYVGFLNKNCLKVLPESIFMA